MSSTERIKRWYSGLTPVAKGFILIIFILLVGIIIRRREVLDGFIKGFQFFSK